MKRGDFSRFMGMSKVKTPEMEKALRNQMKTLCGALQSAVDSGVGSVYRRLYS